MKIKLLLATSALALSLATASRASVVTLDFEGVNATYPSGFAFVNNFYNGGTSSDGTTGTNYGISFSANAQAICLNSTTVTCSATSRGGLAPASSEGGLFFLSGNQTFLNDAAGFDTGFSFAYTDPFSSGGNVVVYDGLNGAGNVLANINLSPTLDGASACPGYAADYCPFVDVGVSFAGIAKSIGFGGVANQVVFDDVTFGSATVGGVPEPSAWSLSILGMGLAGAAMRGSRRRKLVTA